MDLIILHHFFNFGHFPDEVSHLLKIHVICVLTSFLRVLNHGLSFLIDLVHDISQVSVPESHPELVFVVEVHHPVVRFHFAVFSDVEVIVNYILIVVVVYNWRDNIKATIKD